MADTERRFVLGIAYPALRKDGHGDYASPATVEKMAHDYMRDGGRQIGIYHVDGTTSHAIVLESYVHRGPSQTFTAPTGGEVTINEGDWVLGAEFDPQAWALVKAGKVDGWSIDGYARRRKAAAA